MNNKIINPFKNESECLQIGSLTVENRIDRVSIYGSIDITRDKEGLAVARELKSILDLTLTELESAELPDKVTQKPAKIVKNPFE
ncbi:hypothetical protein GSUET_05560 [Geobacter sulfurreducens subsp. ethanolicus]|uniref:Uncharacterized protein n=1 Tax=Geomobilimonas luticola TaxID=1114878 RepID=A0ABS5SB21_9BACT|nr:MULTISPECIES: hypothetical protein [Geobacteraceae]MBT0652551.1 hypothetical protein [Geomobilimonas luticola]BEH08944.1 hypothetical protein GSUET_05560 [Geobacter sulfurreducens subsp. ethanolicus]